MNRFFNFVTRNKNKIIASAGIAMATCGTAISSFASGNTATYSVKPVPTAQTMDLSSLGDVWNYGQSMLQDTIALISQSPLLIALVLTLPQLFRGSINMVNALLAVCRNVLTVKAKTLCHANTVPSLI